MQRGTGLKEGASLLLALAVSLFSISGCGKNETPVGTQGSAGAAGECQDYVTPDGYTCCCGVSFCSRTPGCVHDGVMTMPQRMLGTGGSVSGAGGRAGTGGAPGGPYPAPHADFPQVALQGGPVLRAPRLVPIFFPGDALKSQLEKFMAALPGSYWSTTTKEYGVGPLTVAPSVIVSDTPPASIDDPEVEAWLAGLVDSGALGTPAPDDVYTVFYPQATTITLFGEVSCSAFGGYHNEGVRHASTGPRAPSDGGTAPDARASGDAGMAPKDAGTPRDAGVLREGGGADVPFAYAVIARCPPLGSRSTIDDLTIAVSHEMIEASTDPFVQTNTAYDFVDPSNAAWLFGFTSDPLGEVADLCVYDSGDGLLDQYTVTRSWSNRAAASGLDPCVPSSGTYYGAAPIVQDSVSINGILATGLSIPVGRSKTVDVHLFSAAPTAAWFVTAIEGPLQAPANTLDLTWNQVSGKNGDVLKLTVMRRDRGPFDGSSVVLIASSLQGFRSGYLDGSVWPMVVGD